MPTAALPAAMAVTAPLAAATATASVTMGAVGTGPVALPGTMVLMFAGMGLRLILFYVFNVLIGIEIGHFLLHMVI
jgi:hypothetical protein